MAAHYRAIANHSSGDSKSSSSTTSTPPSTTSPDDASRDRTPLIGNGQDGTAWCYWFGVSKATKWQCWMAKKRKKKSPIASGLLGNPWHLSKWGWKDGEGRELIRRDSLTNIFQGQVNVSCSVLRFVFFFNFWQKHSCTDPEKCKGAPKCVPNIPKTNFPEYLLWLILHPPPSFPTAWLCLHQHHWEDGWPSRLTKCPVAIHCARSETRSAFDSR